MIAVDADARAYVRQPGLRRPLACARERFERLGRAGGAVVLDDLSAEEANALGGLLPRRRRERPRSGRPFRLRLADVDEALQATRFGISLREALELIGPPLDLRPERVERERAAAAAAWEDAFRHPLCDRDPHVRAWVESLRESGLVTRIAGADGFATLAQSLELGSGLPAVPPVERTRLATELTGDPHALDENRPLTRLTLSQLAYLAGVARPEVAVERRALWQQFGVSSDPASTDVLTLNLRPLPNGPLARALRLMEGRHFRLTVGQLAQESLEFEPGVDVFVCENPTVLTAAEARLGKACPPVVCIGGWPTSAAWRAARQEANTALVAAMRETGLELHEEAILEELLDDLGRSAR